MNFFNKKKNNHKFHEKSFSTIQRTMEIEGKMIPAFICNGGSYFYTNLEVYSDGIIDAWGAVDLDFFQRKLSNNWVATSLPEGTEISIHHLGHLKIKKGEWHFDKKTFYDYVVELIKEMNPQLENLYNFHGSDTVRRGEVNGARLPSFQGSPIKPKDENYPSLAKLTGNNVSAFLQESDDTYHLCNVSVFADESIRIDNVAKPINTDLEGLKEMVNNFKLVTTLKQGHTVQIYGMGHFEVEEVLYANKIESLVGEIDDIIATLNAQPTSSQLCKNIYEEYLATPTVRLRAELRVAYEKVPEHLRIYILGDMDVKDIPIRMIIYGEEEIKKWSHYLLSEQEGYAFPQLHVPQPMDEE